LIPGRTLPGQKRALMATDTHKYGAQAEREPHHSALEEFSRDERRPAVLLLSALLLSALFFGIGLLVGRWTAEPNKASSGTPKQSATTASTPAPTPQPMISPASNVASEVAPSAAARRFSLLIATYDTTEKAQALVKALQEAGYTDIRTSSPRAGDTRPRYSVITGRFTQDEAREALQRMRSINDPRLKNARVVESNGQ
jgi:septal ring-binding cell division protein DamX